MLLKKADVSIPKNLHTIINPFPPSSNPHALAICNIPSGLGFGGRKSRVTIGANVLPGKKFWRRCITGPLFDASAFPKRPLPAPIRRPESLSGFRHCDEEYLNDKGQQRTRNSSYTIPFSRVCSRGTRSASPGPVALPGGSWLPIRWLGSRSGLLTGLVRVRSGCDRGCRWIWGC